MSSDNGSGSGSSSSSSKKGGRGLVDDAGSMALLFVLYTLQGIPMGLSGSVPLLLAKRVSYAEQAVLSFCSWPFSLKLFWAPVVDSIFLPSFGRRKSWLVPVQLLCGCMMVGVAPWLNGWVGDGDGDGVPDASRGSEPRVYPLAAYFFLLYFLMATQDIAVDGWALTMLSPENVGYASTCNSVGQTLGYFIAFIGFLTLNDPETCNKYLRSADARVADRGMVTLAGFVKFWGWIFVVTTLYVWFFKAEKPEKIPGKDEDGDGRVQDASDGESGKLGPLLPASDGAAVGVAAAAAAAAASSSPGGAVLHQTTSDAPKSSSSAGGDWQAVLHTYRQLWLVLQLPAVRTLCVVLLTCKVGFAVTDAATTLK